MKATKNNLIGLVAIIFTVLCPMVGSIRAMEQELENLWVTTEDGQKMTIPFWQLDKLPVVKRLSSRQQGANSYHNPTRIPVKENHLSLVQNALDVLKKSENFCRFFNGLSYNEKIKLDHAVSVLEADSIDSALDKCSYIGTTIKGISF